MLEDFRFLARVAKVMPKMTVPAPSVLHFRGGRAAISRKVYPDLERFFEDTARAYRDVVQAFYAAGCRYLQFDDTVWAYLCSDQEREAARSRSDDPEPLPRIYAEMINYALADKPTDLVVTTHVCRGNFRSSWIAEGGYEPIAETLLAAPTTMAISSNTTAHGRAALSPCVFCRRAANVWCWASSPPSSVSSKAKNCCARASTRRPGMPPMGSCA